MKNRQAPLLLALILSAPALASADNIPAHSSAENNYVTFSEGFADQHDSQGSSAPCNFLSGSTRENGLQTDSIEGASFSGIAKVEFVKLFDFGLNQSASSDEDKGKGLGKQHRGDGDGNGSGGSSAPLPVIAAAEPGSQSLLLFALAAVAMLFYRRKALTNAI